MRRTILNTIFLLTTLWVQASSMTSVSITPLEISDVKWVYLQFLSDVKYADRGTDDIVIEVTAVPSIVRVKSLVPTFDKTSITIITLDGVVHTYSLSYQQNPKSIAYNVGTEGMKAIESHPIELSHRQTSHIVFPNKTVDVSTGSEKVIVMQAEEIENIVKCRSISEGFDYFKESSLTVITEDGRIYPFIVSYNDTPALVNIQMKTEGANNADVNATKTEAIFSSLSINEPEMRKLGNIVLKSGSRIHNLGSYRDKMSFSLLGIYVKEDVMMFYLNMDNLSKVDYEIDFIKSYIINKKTTKNQAYQADEKVPLFVCKLSPNDIISAGGKQSEVFFFKRFTIPRKHSLFFEVFEKNGGRHLKFTVPNKVLLEAKSLAGL